MTKKKRELIEILLDNVKPEDWPEDAEYAAQDKYSNLFGKNKVMFYAYAKPKTTSSAKTYYIGNMLGGPIQLPELCKNWNKTIVHRDEFMKRWNERNGPVELKTPQQLALEKFGTVWYENDGVQPIDDEVLIDAIVDGVIYKDMKIVKCTWTYLVSGAFEVKKWRIHSSTNATTPPAQQEYNTEETKPIQQEVKATDKQVGGDHYTKLAIQPMRYSMENGLDALQHTIIKYVTRFRDKAGIEDLEKAKHCIDMLIEFEKESK